MYKNIVAYRCVFSQTSNTGDIYLKLNDGEEINLQHLLSETYTAILLTLNHPTAQWNDEHKCIGLGIETP